MTSLMLLNDEFELEINVESKVCFFFLKNCQNKIIKRLTI